MYDRLALVAKLREDFPEAEIAAVREGCDYAVIVCGCGRACVDHESIDGRLGKAVAARMEDYGEIARSIRDALTEME